MRIIGKLRASRLRLQTGTTQGLYTNTHLPTEIRVWQLRQFNSIWKRISSESSYFQALKARGQAPRVFDSWKEFCQCVPIMTRETLRQNINEMRLGTGSADYHRITGGSTSEPIQLPAWRSEDRITGLDTWRGRSWYGVDPSDRLFLLWGHSHLLGRGVRGWLDGKWRALKDYGLGYCRRSAYDLGAESLRETAGSLLRFEPEYIVGYSVALHRLAHANQHLRDEFRKLPLKVIIATGESFPTHDSASLISNVFGCPVAMEYGAVETGTIAHQRPDGRFQVFWANYFLEGVESTLWPGRYELLVTALYPRVTPLIRYRIGDLIAPNPSAIDFDQTLDTIVGRCNDGISVGEGTFVHSEAFSHVLRNMKDIQAFQVMQNSADEIVISYVAEHEISHTTQEYLQRRFEAVDRRLQIQRFERVARLEETVAGKTKRIVRDGMLRYV